MRTPGPLFDREGETARLGAALDAGVRGDGALVYVEGHAGIGKSRLLEVAGELATARGALVLAARGGELERDFGHGVVRQLLERVVADAEPAVAEELLAGPAALAAVALRPAGGGASGSASAVPDSPFPVVHALAWLTANLAARQPLVLLVDDAHWSDAPSLRFLDFLAARLDGLAVTVVLAARPAEAEGAAGEPVGGDAAGARTVGARDDDVGAAAASELLRQLRDGRRPVLLTPAPLGEDATAALLRDGFGSEPDVAFVTACRRSSAGNPFLLHELIGELRRDGVAPRRAGAAAVEDVGPATIARSLKLRLARLPGEASAVVDAVAVFGRTAEVRHVAAATDLDAARVGELADLLADAGVLAPGRPLRFAHPVVRQAVYAWLRPAARAALHARAATALTAEGRPPEEVARHLMLVEPAGDAAAVATLRAVGAAAVAQGSADVALPHLRRALAEPPEPAARGELLAELGRAEALVGDLARAGEHLEQAAAAAGDPAERAVRLQAAARTRVYRGDLEGAVALLEHAREGVDEETDLRLTAHAAAIGVLRPPLAAAALARLERHAAARHGTPALRGGRADAAGDGPAARGPNGPPVSGELAADAPGDTPAQLAALAELAGARWVDGRIEEAADLAERALAGGVLADAEGPGSIVVNHPLRVLVDADRHALALPVVERLLRRARGQGSVLAVVSLLGVRAVAAWRMGDVRDAEARARELLELTTTQIAKPAHWAQLGLALVERGELEEAEQAIARCGAGSGPPLTYMGVTLHARARLRLAQGRPRDALLDLLQLRSDEAQLGVGHLSVGWQRTAVEAALAVGDAEGALAFADEQLQRAARWSTASGRGLALSTQGLAVGGGEGLALLAEGAELLSSSPARLDHARALVDLGAALRRAGRPAQAREPLRKGLEAAQCCGATALAESAHAELVVAGAKPRRLRFSGADALTAAERRVARLAAEGWSNREIAAALYVTVRTVENHLARSYRKLGIGSRRELPEGLARAAKEE